MVDLKQEWQRGFEKNIVEPLDQSNENSLSQDLDSLKHVHLLKEISDASDHASESSQKSKIQVIDFEDCRNRPDMILDFSNSLMSLF